TAFKAGHTRVPGAQGRRHELNDAAITADKKMRGNMKPAQAFEPGMSAVVEPVGEEIGDFGAAEDARRQADVVQDEKGGLIARRSGIVVGGGLMRDAASGFEPAVLVERECNQCLTPRRACSWLH